MHRLRVLILSLFTTASFAACGGGAKQVPDTDPIEQSSGDSVTPDGAGEAGDMDDFGDMGDEEEPSEEMPDDDLGTGGAVDDM